ncbi:Elongator complex protein 1 [Nymphon striatum]|nr:Elongator complex protein 1 [Nymphon striatum]
MKNLNVSRCVSFCHRLLKGSPTFCVDSSSSTSYFITEEGLIKLSGDEDVSIIVTCEQLSVFGLTCSQENITKETISLSYIALENSLYIITADGHFLQVTLETNNDNVQLESIGSIPCGIKACAWSPDQELVSVVTGIDGIVLMTRSFQVLAEVSCDESDKCEINQVSVGWGTKETQFHGSEGKAAAKVITDKAVSLLEWDDKKPRICWRGDGEFFVISLIKKEKNFRQLHVYNREGILQCINENTVGLEHVLHWKPSGNLIGCTQQYQNKHKVIFFEKNGLQHGEFVLPYSPGKVLVKDLMWNADSSVLAIQYQPMAETAGEKYASWIELWTVNNYHWYLKLTFNFKNIVDKMLWDFEEPLKLNVLLDNSSFLLYKLQFSVDCASWRSLINQGLVPVIHGQNVFISAFRVAVYPPPMSNETILVDRPANQVFFQHCSNNLGIATCDGDLYLYHYIAKDPENSTFKLDSHSYELKANIQNPNVNLDSVGNWTWLSETDFVFTFCKGRQSFLKHFTLSSTEESASLNENSETILEGEIESVTQSVNSSALLIQFSDGGIVQYDYEKEVIYPFMDQYEQPVKFPIPCHSIQAVNISGDNFIIGLNQYFHLLYNNVELTRDCTSFTISDAFLIFSTQRHLLKCIALTDMNTKDVKSHIETLNSREIERGANLVISIPFDTKVILQMPRGNLETIHPRSLVLREISQHLNNLKFKPAFEMMRKHRINMNLMFDHCPKLFLEHTDELIQQLNDSTALCLFITELEEKDFCLTMYNNYCIYHKKSNSSDIMNKVDCICDALRNKMEEIDYEKYILPILTCHIKKSTSEMELALKKIQKIYKSGKVSLASDCLRHLLYIVDVNCLYEHALGMYDFDIVMMVAEKSQKDPKEYLPFLNNLQNMELNYRCFKIDSHLKRHDKALCHLSKCEGQFVEFLAYMKNYDLFVTALKYFPKDSNEHLTISSQYAHSLKDKKLHADAAVWFSKAKLHEEAICCFLDANKWQIALGYAYKAGYKNEQILKLCNQIVTNLKNSHNYLEAATLLEHYLKDIEECLIVLITGQEWEEALAIVNKYNRFDLIETNLTPCITDSATVTVNIMKHLRESFDNNNRRLKIVREEKKKKAELAEDPDFDDTNADLYSDISSVRSELSFSSSRSSQRSRVSAKSRKKMEKKKYSLKEGSRYEEEALLIALSEIVQQVNDMKGTIQKHTFTLCLLDHNEMAQSMQTNLKDLCNHLNEENSNIWPNKKSENIFGENSTANSIINNVNSLTNSADVDLDMLKQMLPPKANELKWQLTFLKDI